MLYAAFAAISLMPSDLSAQVDGEARAPRRVSINPFGTPLTKEQRQRLAVGPAESIPYSKVLSMPDSGIFRMIPDGGCFENPQVLKVDQRCLDAIPLGPYYSFRKRSHAAEAFADLRLSKGNLITDPIRSQGLMTVLGDVPLETVAADTPGIGFLRSFEPKTMAGDVQRQFDRFAAGVAADGFAYAKALPAAVGTTYALRVIAYRGALIRSYRGFRVDLMAGDRRFDILVAFRVVGRDEQGALTVVWRQIERKTAPKLRNQKR
jgi:hypothetical protein